MMSVTISYLLRGRHGGKAVSAEQDNRVRFPNGTAAVNAELEPMAKAGHWKQFREGRVKRWKLQPFLQA